LSKIIWIDGITDNIAQSSSFGVGVFKGVESISALKSTISSNPIL
jgi:hypothetical protein